MTKESMDLFGYEFVTLDKAGKKDRRNSLFLYASIAQCSALVVFALFQLSFLLYWLAERSPENDRPKSPSLRPKRGERSHLRKVNQAFRRLSWWASKPAWEGWGTRGEWVLASIWTIWLLFCSVHGTGNDYLHLTKRFGIIGASQLPLQYLLAMRSPHSPAQLLTRLSHEQLKASHQILGRIVYCFFILHAAFYLNFFIQAGAFAKRMKDTDVILGIIGLAMFSVLSTTAFDILRRWNYRVFYVTHILIAGMVLWPLFFHVKHIRIYIVEVFVVTVLHQVFRYSSIRRYSGTLSLIRGTSLVELRVPLTTVNEGMEWKPGQHVYLSRPTGVSPSFGWYESFVLMNQTNPLTIASLPRKDKELVLIARALKGNTKKLSELARSLSSQTGAGEAHPTISIALEGPYGASNRLPDLSYFDRILFVAGGVGATFTVPIYRSIMEQEGPLRPTTPQVRFVWAVRKLAETQWAFPRSREDQDEAEQPTHSSGAEVYVTQPSGPDLQAQTDEDDIELAESDQLLSTEEELEKSRRGMTVKTGRPNIAFIVDEVFGKSTGKVAIIACGPHGLVEQLREAVEPFVKLGHDVYWHNETFAW